ncbi:phage late control D family protein [Paenibacillus yanchengensis]|uniref:Phage late control D family protein n=1 Tax=Paenibacillus yanchengensis TaxID=2035833 RepID=A0ABW4YEN7_9BACL
MSDIKLDSKTYTFDQLEKKYRQFIAPGYKIRVDGQDIVKAGMAIRELTVETTIANEADTAMFTIVNGYNLVSRQFEWLGGLLALGKEIEVHIGYTDQMTAIFSGYITNINTEFYPNETPTIAVTGMDLSFKMMRNRAAQTWSNKTISDVVRSIGQQNGISQFEMDSTTEQLPTFTKKPDNDFHFLQMLAQSINYECFVVGKTLYFRKYGHHTSSVITLSLGKHLQYLQMEQSIAEQVSDVTVRSWDAEKQQILIGTASKMQPIGSNTKTGADIMRTLGKFEEVLYLNAADSHDAKLKATAALHRRAMRLVEGEAHCLGLPELRAGRFVTFDGLGKQLNQPYYIKTATHILNEQGYSTRLRVQGNAV